MLRDTIDEDGGREDGKECTFYANIVGSINRAVVDECWQGQLRMKMIKEAVHFSKQCQIIISN